MAKKQLNSRDDIIYVNSKSYIEMHYSIYSQIKDLDIFVKGEYFKSTKTIMVKVVDKESEPLARQILRHCKALL